MSLLPDFFIARERALVKYRAQDYLLLEELIEQRKINFGQLAATDLIQEKELCTTAELYEFELTEAGKRHFREIKNYELFLIKQSKYQKLRRLLQD